jgi:hypothetical protein
MLNLIVLLTPTLALATLFYVIVAALPYDLRTLAIVVMACLCAIPIYVIIVATIIIKYGSSRVTSRLVFFPYPAPLMKIADWLINGSKFVSIGIAILLLTVAIRIGATCLYIRSGVAALPSNFRRLILCTSPAQPPELVPGLEATSSALKFSNMLDFLRSNLDWHNVELLPAVLIPTLPAWLYRITIKSTAWFWWPLAFLGGDLKRVQRPEVLHWQVMGSLWAKTSIALAILSLVAFAAANLVFDGAMFERNPLLTPVGYLLLIDWKLRSWQVCALAGSALSVVIVYLLNDVSGQYRIAQDINDSELLNAAQYKFGWIERLARFRFLVLLLFWCLVGTHAFLYANSTQCWFSLSSKLQEWAQDIYGDRIPRSNKCPRLR